MAIVDVDGFLPGTVTWTTSNAAVATVDTSGMVLGVASGTTTITARSIADASKSGTATVTVTAAAVASVVVSPPSSSVAVGTTQPLTATIRDGSGTTLTGRTLTWASSNVAIATVSLLGGLVTGTAAGGPVTITATSEGISGTAQVTVTVPVGAATLVATPSISAFSATVGAALPTAQAITITRGEAGTLTSLTRGTITYGAGEPAGWLGTATLNSTTTPATLTLQPNTTNLAASTTYHATVPITAAGGVSGSVNVTYAISPPGAARNISVILQATCDLSTVRTFQLYWDGVLVANDTYTSITVNLTSLGFDGSASPGVHTLGFAIASQTSSPNSCFVYGYVFVIGVENLYFSGTRSIATGVVSNFPITIH